MAKTKKESVDRSAVAVVHGFTAVFAGGGDFIFRRSQHDESTSRWIAARGEQAHQSSASRREQPERLKRQRRIRERRRPAARQRRTTSIGVARQQAPQRVF